MIIVKTMRYDSRMGGREYAQWTTGSQYENTETKKIVRVENFPNGHKKMYVPTLAELEERGWHEIEPRDIKEEDLSIELLDLLKNQK